MLFDVDGLEAVDKYRVFAVVGDQVMPLEHDATNAHTWHTPKNYGEYLKSPQRGLWRTAMELKMDQYRALDVFELVTEEYARGFNTGIMGSLWAFKIKFDEIGAFQKLNPRWCVMGGDMSREIYESYSDVMKWVTLLIMGAIRSSYKVDDFQFDISDAFQATRTDKPVAPLNGPNVGDQLSNGPRLFYRQAPGFEEFGPNGEKMVCAAKTAQQGRIDSARLFGTAFGHTLLKRAGARRQISDPEAWEYHAGPLANSAADLEKILAACAKMPPTAGAPPGWAVFGRHVDDGIGIASRSEAPRAIGPDEC
eukprot:3271355-Prymnesium_polylepis.2